MQGRCVRRRAAVLGVFGRVFLTCEADDRARLPVQVSVRILDIRWQRLIGYSSILGWSALAGVVVVLVAYVLNYPLAKYNIFVRAWFRLLRTYLTFMVRSRDVPGRRATPA